MFSPRLRVAVPSCVLRHLHLCAINNKNYANRQAKMLTKLMTGSIKKKKSWYNFEMEARTSPALFKNERPNKQGLKRVDVLNKLLMRSITDLLATEEVSADILGQGISITRIKVSPDFSTVNVYWSGKGKSPEVELEELLKKTAFKLRHELIQLHVMSIVPRIEFVADKHHILIEEVERRLAKITSEYDCRVESISHLKTEPILNTQLKPEIQERIEELTFKEEQPLPLMTHDVLGLDHAQIMKKLQSRIQKAQAPHRRNPDIDKGYSIIRNDDGTSSMEREITPADFANFIKKRKIAKNKQMKQINTLSAEKELLETELNVKEEYVDIDDGDFIEEFESNYKEKDKYW